MFVIGNRDLRFVFVTARLQFDIHVGPRRLRHRLDLNRRHGRFRAYHGDLQGVLKFRLLDTHLPRHFSRRHPFRAVDLRLGEFLVLLHLQPRHFVRVVRLHAFEHQAFLVALRLGLEFRLFLLRRRLVRLRLGLRLRRPRIGFGRLLLRRGGIGEELIRRLLPGLFDQPYRRRIDVRQGDDRALCTTLSRNDFLLNRQNLRHRRQLLRPTGRA